MEDKPLPESSPSLTEETQDHGMPKDVTNIAMLAHLLGALCGFVGPLIIWLVKKDEHPFIDQEAKEALNFQLTMLIWYFVAMIIFAISCGLIFFAPFIPMLLQVILGIVGAVAAGKGEAYRYPMAIRFVK